MKTFAAALLAASAYGCAILKSSNCLDCNSFRYQATGSYLMCMYSYECEGYVDPAMVDKYDKQNFCGNQLLNLDVDFSLDFSGADIDIVDNSLKTMDC